MRHLVDDLYLTTDKYNYIITRRSIIQSGKNKGSEKFDDVAFFGSNITLLYKRLLELKVLEKIENTSYEELLKFCKDIIELKEKDANSVD